MNAALLRIASLVVLLGISAPASTFAAPNHGSVRVERDARAENDTPPFPDTPQGRTVQAWFRAFHGTEADMRALYRDHYAPGHRTPEERLGTWRTLREQAGSFTTLRIRESARGIEVVARDAEGGRARLDFEFEASPPHKLLGVRIEPLDEDEADEASVPSTPLTEAQAVDTIAAQAASLASQDRFSGVVRVERGGRVLLQRAYGLADREAKLANAVDTRFNLGSINKMFTKSVITKLIEQGRIAPDDKLSKHLPDFPRDKGDKVTIQQLLDMKSGMGDFFGPRYDAADKSKLVNPRDWFPLFQDDPLGFEPGTSTRYSNAGYTVLGAVAEAVTGRSYYDLVREIVYAPAGMTASDSYGKDEAVANRARGYVRRGGPLRRNDESLPGRGSPAGGGYSTASDLSRFVSALAGGKIVKPETLERFYGGTKRPDGTIELNTGFAGGANGINAIVLNFQHDRVIVLANLDPPAAESLGTWIRKTLGRMKE